MMHASDPIVPFWNRLREISLYPLRGDALMTIGGVASLMADMLVDAGYLVETVSDARMALRRLEAEPFDVILSDVRMPEMTGPSRF